MIVITAALNNARLAGIVGFLDAGTSPAQIQLYGGTRPATPLLAPGTPLLAAINLAKPSGTIQNDELVLVPASTDAMVQSSGIAAWARMVAGDGTVGFDCDAGEGLGPWAVQLAQVQLFAGGAVRLLRAVLV